MIQACPECHHFACICAVLAAHVASCTYRRAVTAVVGLACGHGFDVCPTCDPCTCGGGSDA